MTAAELLREVERRGGRLVRNGDGVRVTAPAPLPGELMERLRERKGELLRLLAGETFTNYGRGYRHADGRVESGEPEPIPAPALPWPDDLTAGLRRVAVAFEWTDADRRDFVAWARRSAQGLADAAEFLAAELAKLPVDGLAERRRVVLAMLADDPALRVAWTCADDGASEPVRLTLAIRGRGACELAIPRAGFDALALPQLIGGLVEQRGDE